MYPESMMNVININAVTIYQRNLIQMHFREPILVQVDWNDSQTKKESSYDRPTGAL